VILNKPGRLTPDEFEKMKHHSDAGYKIIDNMMHTVDEADAGYLAQAEDMAHYHHEKWNGEGYPEGLKGEQIPLSARIMAVADVFDALVSRRSYKAGMPFEKAMDIIKEGSGSHFDPQIVKAFVDSEAEVRKIAEDRNSDK
jgi:HD-GYP domain-containing protein (c-di-GMP phosphodiesterase class II)